MRHLDSDLLSAFLGVVDCGSFTSAADRLAKSQAAVSMMVGRLEQRLGVRLFDRSARKVTLTPAGERLVGYARRMRALEDEALEALMGKAPDSRVRLGMPDDYLQLFGNALVQRFHPQYPKVQIDLQCHFSHQIEPMTARGELDLAVITRGADAPHGELLRREQLVWCTGPTHSPEDADLVELALFPEACRARPLILKALDDAERRWRIAYSSSHVQGVHVAVMSGHLLTALPESTIPADWRCLGRAEGLPPLPALELALLLTPGATLATRQVAAFMRREFGTAASPPAAADAGAA